MERTERGCEELLDYLADRSGCAYLSDLRIPSAAARLEYVIQNTAWNVWTTEAWQEAASYITGEGSGTSEAEARKILITWCRNCGRQTGER